MIQNLPLGTSDFSALRQFDEIYVDKTELIYDLASQKSKYFFVRPRRFGKSLLISTFESLFKYGLKEFRGLAIEGLYKNETKYLVVKLDFSEAKYFSSPEEFSERLASLIVRNFSRVGFSYVPGSAESIFYQWSEWLKTLDSNSLVVLVDEYDSPLTYCLGQEELFAAVREQLSKFYAGLSANERVLRFVFVTGIILFDEVCLSSEFGHFTDLSLDPRYGSLVGFTREEVEGYFENYIEKSEKELSISRDDLMKQLVAQYGGYCFEEAGSTKVLASWSLLNFLAQSSRDFQAYWFETGGTASLLKCLKTQAVKAPEEFSREKRISRSELLGVSGSLSDIALLTQAGYLTIKAPESGGTFLLDYPNLEVRRSTARLYAEQLLDGRIPGQVGAGPIVEALSEGSLEFVFFVLNQFFLAIDYQKYPVKDEATLRAYVQVYFAAAGVEIVEEYRGANGRKELKVKAGRQDWLFDLRIVKDLKDASVHCVDADECMRKTHLGHQEGRKDLRKVELVFSTGARQFVQWLEDKIL